MDKKNKVRISLFLEFIILLVILGISSIFMSNSDLSEETLSLVDIDSNTKISTKIKEISEKYNIKIIYGLDTIDLATNVNANMLTDENIILQQLDILKKALSKYEDDFFKKDRLTIILLESFNNNNLALASKNNLGEYKIYLSNTINFERSIHHEIYHVFEYMNDIKSNLQYSTWNELNPKEFSYEEKLNLLNNNYIFGSNNDELNVYFVSKYSKTSPKEDRAEIFAEVMLEKYDFRKNINLIKKINAIEEVITATSSNVLIDINKYD